MSVVCVCVFFFIVFFFCFFYVFFFFLELSATKGWFFQRVYLYIWTSWVWKFDNFSEFQNVISDSPPTLSVIMTHCVRKSICDAPLGRKFAISSYFPTMSLATLKKSLMNLNDFVKSLAHILNFEFYCPYYILVKLWYSTLWLHWNFPWKRATSLFIIYLNRRKCRTQKKSRKSRWRLRGFTRKTSRTLIVAQHYLK